MHRGEPAPFSGKPVFSVNRSRNITKTGRSPSITIDDEITFIALRIAKQGFYDGDPEKVLNAPVGIVQAILDYEIFELDYKEEYNHLNPSKEM